MNSLPATALSMTFRARPAWFALPISFQAYSARPALRSCEFLPVRSILRTPPVKPHPPGTIRTAFRILISSRALFFLPASSNESSIHGSVRARSMPTALPSIRLGSAGLNVRRTKPANFLPSPAPLGSKCAPTWRVRYSATRTRSAWPVPSKFACRSSTLRSLNLFAPCRTKPAAVPASRKPSSRTALGDALPSEILAQPKRTFTLPWETWLRGPLRDRLTASFAAPAPALAPFLKPDALHTIWAEFQSGKTTWSRPWSLYVLNEWCKSHFD